MIRWILGFQVYPWLMSSTLTLKNLGMIAAIAPIFPSLSNEDNSPSNTAASFGTDSLPLGLLKNQSSMLPVMYTSITDQSKLEKSPG